LLNVSPRLVADQPHARRLRGRDAVAGRIAGRPGAPSAPCGAAQLLLAANRVT
jgi:hypothetical protein